MLLNEYHYFYNLSKILVESKYLLTWRHFQDNYDRFHFFPVCPRHFRFWMGLNVHTRKTNKKTFLPG